MTRALLAALLALTACSADEDAQRCDIGVSTAEIKAADRKIIGTAAAYSADGMMRAREDLLRRSQKARREVAWNTVAKVLAPVSLNVPLAPAGQIPTWQTWYGRDDISRMFHRLYEGLGPEGRADARAFAEADLDEAFGWNITAVEELDNWPEQRWQDYLASIDEASEVAGLGGVAPVVYSPSSARHMLSSYSEIVSCLDNGRPEAFVDAPPTGEQRAVREPVSLASCRERLFGPYFVANGESLRALFDGDDTAGSILHVRSSPRLDAVVCEAGPGEACVVDGGAHYYVAVRAGDEGSSGTIAVDFTEANAAWAGCLRSAFPLDSAVVKASWHRAQHQFELPAFDTSAARLDAVVHSEDAEWSESGDSAADPGAEHIYTMKLDNGNAYRLAGLHIMTKELDHWLWITLWWSPDPDTDFGADRPATLGGPWKNYKMCVATAFEERDPDPTGGFSNTAPTLADALAAVHPGVGGPTWCSNPYLEQGKGNAATNCIGCHQHGGTTASTETILGDPSAFPAHGRTLLRNNFPTDYSFAIDNGDRVGPMFRDVVRYYQTFE